MATSPKPSKTAADDDRALVTIVGTVLLLAVVVTAYSQTVTTELPRRGADAEREWDTRVGEAMSDLARNVDYRGAPARATVPAPPAGASLDVPLIGHSTGMRASASVGLEPDCTSFNAAHASAAGVTVTDLVNASRGCVTLDAEPAYADRFSYRIEFGGVLRVQGDRAVVLEGPQMEIDATEDDVHVVRIAIPSFTGVSRGVTTQSTPIGVQVVPSFLAPDGAALPNAASVAWTFETEFPEAWKRWFENAFEDAGLAAGEFDLACDPADCDPPTGETGDLTVGLFGPTSADDDLVFSVSHGAFAVHAS